MLSVLKMRAALLLLGRDALGAASLVEASQLTEGSPQLRERVRNAAVRQSELAIAA